ncbi:hypothetical protein, partial [Burkholderia pseudomallei]|uniref:hypothetical protein n=2 Tax=Burkholderia pseudomallei TaxID=28450 RepID=UPI001C4BA555
DARASRRARGRRMPARVRGVGRSRRCVIEAGNKRYHENPVCRRAAVSYTRLAMGARMHASCDAPSETAQRMYRTPSRCGAMR